MKFSAKFTLIVLSLLASSVYAERSPDYKETLDAVRKDGSEPEQVKAIRAEYQAAVKLSSEQKENRIYRQEKISENGTSIILNISYVGSEQGNIASTFYITANPKGVKGWSSEYLFDKNSGELIFAYDRDASSKKKLELRCYWQNGELIHSKINGSLHDDCATLKLRAEELKAMAK